MILSCTDAKKTMDNRQLTFSHLLYLTAHHWRLAVNRRLKDLGMSQASWVAVAAIARNADPLSQIELAQELGVESATIVPLVNRLVGLGWSSALSPSAINANGCWSPRKRVLRSITRSKPWRTPCAKRSSVPSPPRSASALSGYWKLCCASWRKNNAAPRE